MSAYSVLEGFQLDWEQVGEDRQVVGAVRGLEKQPPSDLELILNAVSWEMHLLSLGVVRRLIRWNAWVGFKLEKLYKWEDI